MTPEQFDRWKDFSVRMALHGFPHATAARRKKIEDRVLSFFSWRERDSEETAKIIDWDNTPSYESGGRTYYNPSVGDEVSSFLNDHEHYHYNERTGREVECGNKFANQVSCCIRAGLDRASSPSAGVVGFTVGDLRRMYPDGLPDWVIEGYEPPITDATPDDAGVWL